MASYEVTIARSAARELEAVDSRADRKRIVERILTLADEPRPAGAEKLAGSDRYRVRQGNYRILYLVDDARREVAIVKIGDRKVVYR